MMDRVVSWSFAVGLAGFLLFMSFQKFFGLDPNPVFGLIEARSGISFFEPGMRYLVGALEVVAAVLVLWPRMRVWGARLGLFIALGAIVFHLSPWLGVEVPNLGALSRALARGASAAQIDGLGLPTDGAAMFRMSLLIAFLAAGSQFVEWWQARARTMAAATTPPPSRPSFA